MQKNQGHGKILTSSPTVYSYHLRADCPHCGAVIVRKEPWLLDFMIRWHDWFYHKIPMDLK